MATKQTLILDALKAALVAYFDDEESWESGPVEVERNVAPPHRISGAGFIVLRDGEPGAPEEVLGGFRNVYYQHAIDIEMYVADGAQEDRDTAWDDLLAGVGAALEGNLTLGGLVHGMSYGLPSAFTEVVEGAPDIKQAVLTVTVDYQTSTPIG